MRGLRTALFGTGAAAVLLYTVGLGIYAVTSTRPAVDTQPATPAAARETLRRLGLEERYPFEARFVQTPHGRMHYVEAGQGSPVLCLHGNPTWSFLYRRFLSGLSDAARVIAPDLIGFGLSEKLARAEDYSIDGHIDDVTALVEALDLRDLTLVLQDWGGPIGLGVALHAPERVRALVIMNTIGFVPDGANGEPGPPLALRLLRLPGLGEQLVQGLGILHRVYVPRGMPRVEERGALARDAYLAVQASWQERAGTLAFPRLIPTRRGDPVVPLLDAEDRFLARFRGPVLLVWGLRDPVFGPRILEAWRRRFPDAPVLELPEAGHFLQEDAPEAIVARVRRFLLAREAPAVYP
jgi:haloalkane dehalogenase